MLQRTVLLATFLAAGLPALAGAERAAATERAELVRGFNAMRAMDCARCHGWDYKGSSGPSLIDAVREGTRERFDRYVLEGDIGRGMPGYRSHRAVTENLDAIYNYLVARAKNQIGPGNPAPSQPPR